jgi:hypothetical protein
VSKNDRAEGMERREFLGAAVAVNGAGLAAQKALAEEAESGAGAGSAPATGETPAKGAASQFYNRQAPKRQKHDRAPPT